MLGARRLAFLYKEKPTTYVYFYRLFKLNKLYHRYMHVVVFTNPLLNVCIEGNIVSYISFFWL